MPEQTIVLRSNPGIKRDGTKFEGDFYVDGQWVRWQRGLPRKMGGYRSTQKYLTEISRGFSTFTQQLFVYCHSGGANKLERFTIDSTGNSSIVTDRTPIAIASTCTVTLTGGAAGSVDDITIDGTSIMTGAVAFNTDLATTADDVATDINVGTGTHGYSATAASGVITIEADISQGSTPNGYVVAVTTTTITATNTNMGGGSFALETSPSNMWMFDYQYDSSTNQNYLMAHVAPNMQCICNDEGGQIFFGEVLGTGKLLSVDLPPDANATGGIVSLHPYMFYYGTDGIIGWSKPGEPTNLTDLAGGAGLARVWGQKIIKGLPLRAGSGSAPAGIFWAYDAVIRATFTGGATVFQFDVIATDTSIISPQCVVDYDGVFFWCGVDRFLMFNGVVREVPNQMNLNYFFDGINPKAKNKVFAFKVTRYGEVWWCYPRGNATECTHAVVYNVRENTWYDTELPNYGRSAGQFNNSFAAPILTGVEDTGSGYRVWVHEQLTDEYDGPNIRPIQSYFETADLSRLVQGQNEYLRITTIEPDFVQRGPMTVQVTGRANARAPEVVSRVFEFPETAAADKPYEQIVVLKEQRRELRVRFESNAVYGNYQMGQIIGHLESGDRTVLG
jgi:hypothetical protein